MAGMPTLRGIGEKECRPISFAEHKEIDCRHMRLELRAQPGWRDFLESFWFLLCTGITAYFLWPSFRHVAEGTWTLRQFFERQAWGIALGGLCFLAAIAAFLGRFSSLALEGRTLTVRSAWLPWKPRRSIDLATMQTADIETVTRIVGRHSREFLALVLFPREGTPSRGELKIPLPAGQDSGSAAAFVAATKRALGKPKIARQ